MRLPNNSHIAHGFAFCNDLATVKNMTLILLHKRTQKWLVDVSFQSTLGLCSKKTATMNGQFA